jgi:hypothetical protein
VLAGAFVLLAITGRVHWIGAVIAAMIPILRKAFPLLLGVLPALRHWRKHRAAKGGNPGGNFSEVKTAVLRMVMDHDSGKLRGEVLDGPFQGMALDALERRDLEQLLDYCQQRDQDSARLLISYLRHRFGEEWQARSSTHGGESASADGAMNREQALAVLGLKGKPSQDEIISAHRRLMQKLHPDRGGNDYLASQINRAKEVLLGEG